MILLLLLLSTSFISSNAQLRIVRVVREFQGNGATVTFRNMGSSSLNVTGYQVGSDYEHIPIHSTDNNSLEVAGSGPIIPSGASWTIDYSPWAAQAREGKFSQSSDISLWKNSVYSDPSNMIDFVQYCNVGVSGTFTCPDFGEYQRAVTRHVWDETTIADRHVRYGPGEELVFIGQVHDHGRRFWITNNPSSPTSSTQTTTPPTIATGTPTPGPPSPVNSNSVPCSEITAEIYHLAFKLLALYSKLGCS